MTSRPVSVEFAVIKRVTRLQSDASMEKLSRRFEGVKTSEPIRRLGSNIRCITTSSD